MKEQLFEILHNRKRMPGERFSDIEGKIEQLVNQEVERRIKEIDQHGRIAVSVIKKKLWSMRFNEEDVRKEADGRRKRFIYGYTEAINDISQWLTEMIVTCSRSRLTHQVTPQDTHQVQKEGGNQ